MTRVERLRAAQVNYEQQLLDLSDPDKRKVTYSIGGRSVDWTGYQRFLLDTIKDIEAQISSADAGDGSADVISAVC